MNAVKKFAFNTVLPAIGALRRNCNNYVNVIYYHDIVKSGGGTSQRINISLFKKQMLYLKNKGYKTLSFDEIENGADINFEKGKILITFDDGWHSNYTIIFDFMKQHGIKYNIFLAAAKIDNDPEYLTWDMVNKMHASGIVGFGAHTYSHPDMQNISDSDINYEIVKSNNIIFEKTGMKPHDFCFPYGKYSDKVLNYILENTDYTRIYTSDMRYSYSKNNKIVFGRSSINSDYPFKTFRHMVKGDYGIYSSFRG